MSNKYFNKFDYNFYITKDALTNYDIIKLVPDYNIKHFRGIYLRDSLPENINNIECGIVNLDSSIKSTDGVRGTHWVCYYKDNSKVFYFDSFGLYPPNELVYYLNDDIITSTFQVQDFNTEYCGYLCLHVLSLLSRGVNFNDIIFKLVEDYGLVNDFKMKN